MSAGAAELVAESKTYEWWLERRPGGLWQVKSWDKSDPQNFDAGNFATRGKAVEFCNTAARLAIEQGL